MRTGAVAVLAGIAVALSAANLVLLLSLLDAKRQVGEAARQAAQALEEAGPSEPAAFIATVSVDEVFSIPVKTSVPIKTTVTVPVVIPILGQVVSLAIPIDTSVPIATTIQVPVKASIPIKIGAGGLPFGDMLRELRDALSSLADRLGW